MANSCFGAVQYEVCVGLEDAGAVAPAAPWRLRPGCTSRAGDRRPRRYYCPQCKVVQLAPEAVTPVAEDLPWSARARERGERIRVLAETGQLGCDAIREGSKLCILSNVDNEGV